MDYGGRRIMFQIVIVRHRNLVEVSLFDSTSKYGAMTAKLTQGLAHKKRTVFYCPFSFHSSISLGISSDSNTMPNLPVFMFFLKILTLNVVFKKNGSDDP